jgi:flagellar hook-basal body complex protein FliE
MIEALSSQPALTAGVQPLEPLEPTALVAPSQSTGAVFQSILDQAIGSVQKSQQTAAQAVSAVLEGKGGELHSAILATQRAELQFQLLLQYRDKMVSAYQELMKVEI